MAADRKYPNITARTPLSDRTNHLPRRPPSSLAASSSPDFGTSTGSNSAGSPASSSAAGLRRADKPPRHAPDIVAFAGGEQSKHSISKCQQNMLQKKKDKRKSVMVPAPMSCPPAGRIGSIVSKRVNDGPGLLKSSSASLPTSTKPKQRRRHSMPDSVKSYTLPEDFIKKQKAYFAEIDAFELEEEEVSASELD